MDIVDLSIKKPVTVLVGVILIILFGILGLKRMPYQLTPTVTEPEISVETTWRGATPYEIERDIIEEQEKVLKGITGLVEMESSSYNSRGSITLRFKIGTGVDDALLRVSNKINEVPSYPENVDKPIINASGAATSPVIWMIYKAGEDNPGSINTYRTFLENEVRQYLERVDGVADLFVRGGTEDEMHIVVSAHKLAAYKLTIIDVINVLRAENANVSAGTMGVGRRDYRIRTVGEFKSPEEISNVVIKSTGQERILISDVADVGSGYARLNDAIIHNGKDGMAVGVKPEPGTNIIELTDRVEKVVQWLNDNKLRPRGIYLDWVYDQRPYISGAIGLVKKNIAIGGFLAIIVLVIFLRSLTSTVVAATSIPISVIGTFIFMDAFGRNLNVISLAGIAFAVGMLVDNAIVVLENIDRHRQLAKTPIEAAYDGTKEVWGAILASTLTTIAVFLPVLFIKEEAGQLFRDIAMAVTFAVALSLFVSVSVIPMFTKQMFTYRGSKKTKKDTRMSVIGGRLVDCIMTLVKMAILSWKTRILTVVLLTFLAILFTIILFPKMEYLPQGNRNLLLSILVPPPGLSYAERNDIGSYVHETTSPYLGKGHEGLPGIKNLFYVGSDSFMLYGATSTDIDRAAELLPLFQRINFSIPGMFGISQQAGIFQTRLGRGRTIDVDISSGDLNKIIRAAGTMFGMIKKDMPDAQIRPVPSLEVMYPEVRFVPERDKLRAAGMTARDLGIAIDVMMDGREIADYKEEGKKKIDLVLKVPEENISTPEDLYGSLVATPKGDIVPVSSLSRLVRTTGITEVRHLERKRTITLQVTPPFTIPLQEAMERINNGIIPVLKSQGLLDGVGVQMSGAADKLTETRKVLQWNFILAMIIAYLLMAALFENFVYPLIIMFTVPLAWAGGFIGLTIVNLFFSSRLDILTMLGFIILIGVVVNNAILIVHQALNNFRYHGMDHKEAVLESTKSRLRPIYMSAFTSIFGMLPLVVFPGPGQELYRGLGSVVLGGLAMSTFFTVLVIPALLMFAIKMEKRGVDD
ncbi:MAG: efflux RND transporter permease subunit [Thermodesulfovibrionales bacterium]